ncbi:amidase [Mesorhizobium sp. NBSH29]|uniref:amidase n=1 Tax=Mesorhizobium sp. NBSH29 TaxID=2654249 RepID=UPI001896880A|nr:amidase [Mesorhizobium sp. NBSH29]QPC88441.1 amidase [Mesorhizobium sp. NBSH29]
MLPTCDPLNAFLDLPSVPVTSAPSGPLSGMQLAVKDIYDVAGYPTGCGNSSKARVADPVTLTAPAIQQLLDAGATFIGKTQTDELAFSLIGHNAHYPQPVNPAAPDRVTGGSSSGSAAAVAGALADIGTGSDTGGSIRAPASFCGLVGLRTTHGAISLKGTMPLAPSLDTFGWFAKDMLCYRKVAEVLLTGTAFQTWRPMRLSGLEALLLGDADRHEYQRLERIVAKALGDPVVLAPLSHDLEDLYWCFRRIQSHEAWSVHGEWIGDQDRNLGPGVKERFEYGATISNETVAEETVRRKDFTAELTARLGNDGILVMPTVPGAAPLRSLSFGDTQAYRERALHLLCLSGLAGLPQLTLPLGTVNGAPFGISLLGPKNSDLTLLDLGTRIMASAH